MDRGVARDQIARGVWLARGASVARQRCRAPNEGYTDLPSARCVMLKRPPDWAHAKHQLPTAAPGSSRLPDGRLGMGPAHPEARRFADLSADDAGDGCLDFAAQVGRIHGLA